jgi:arylsulfatase A-like enzyme
MKTDHIDKIPFSWLLVLGWMLCCVPGSYSSQNDPRPNIIFILTDDQRWDALGHAGNDIIQTPNMDILAEEGTYFPNAFVTTPICAASRASIITGLYERTHQFTFSTPPLAKKFVELSYFSQLKKQGYHTGFIGKFGMSFENQMDTTIFDYYDPYMAQFYYRLVGEAWNEHKHLTYLTGEKAINFIKRSPKDKPFCLSISFNAPHAEDQSPDQYIYPKDLEGLYSDITIPPPGLDEDNYFHAQPDYVKDGLNKIRWYWRFDTPQKYQKMVKAYYRMITAIDKVLGQIRETLQETGLDDHTIIIFTSDNGYFLGERGLAGKWLMYENSIRIPLIIYDPRDKNPVDVNDQLVLNIDIAPTILDYANVPIPESMQGKSIIPSLKNQKIELRDHFFCEHLYDLKFIPKSEGIRTKEWKYFRYIDDPEHEELYHLVEDPLEMSNLADEKNKTSEINSLRRKCNEKIAELIKAR